VVIDPGVLVSALITRGGTGAPAQLLTAWLEYRFTIIVFDNLLAELKGVLLREKFRRYVTHDEVSQYLNLLTTTAEYREDPSGQSESVTPGTKDDYLFALAEACKASFVVSGDSHLLNVTGHIIEVLTPRDFIKLLFS
jgi:putative PIN family toxin of toxin-antitoxin system